MNLQQAIDKLKDYYHGDMVKVMLWLRAPQYSFKGKAPLDMIKQGKEKTVIKLIREKF